MHSHQNAISAHCVLVSRRGAQTTPRSVLTHCQCIEYAYVLESQCFIGDCRSLFMENKKIEWNRATEKNGKTERTWTRVCVCVYVWNRLFVELN